MDIPDSIRKCGECQLCCRLVPVRSPLLDKDAGQTCPHQRFKKGCLVHATAQMPSECRKWNCRWLINDDTADLSRPDRTHYVIDIVPDYVTMPHPGSGTLQHIQVVQIWIDPRHPEAHRDPALRRYLERRGQEGMVALVRFDCHNSILLVPPNLSHDGEWHEIPNRASQQEHTMDDVAALFGPASIPWSSD
jgi:hypothetical protein